MIQVFLVLAVLAVIFAVGAFLTGHAEGLSDEPQDLASVGIPRDRAMTPDDVQNLRFALALRGYRMDEVDDALDRLAAEIAARDEAIVRLRADVEALAAREEAPVSEWGRAGGNDAPDAATGPVEPEPQPEPAVAPEPAVSSFAPPSPSPEATVAVPPLPSAPPAWATERRGADDYVASDATGEVPADTPVDVPTTPEAWNEIDPTIATSTGPDTPEFVEPPENPFRPVVPEIPTYDPWAVTPRSRYTDGPTYVEVDEEDDHDPVEAIAEHHTGYAPTSAPAATDADGDDEDDAGPAQPGTPPWQS